jgi:RimJ/RimL family protein N-acetyltransferase
VAPTNTDGLRVRHAVTAEHDQLREVRLSSLASDPQAFAGTYAQALSHPPQWWERWAEQSERGDSQRTFVLEGDHGQWMGLALVRLDEERSGCAVLNAMWVAPETRRRGAAGLLCDACAAWAAARGCRELALTVVVDNHAARRAFEAAGFAVCGERTWTGDGRTLEELVMVRSL